MLLEAYERDAHGALGYSSWAEYFEAEFGGGKSQAYRVIDAGRVVRALKEHSPIGEPLPNEAQARELATLAKEDPQEAADIWRNVVEENPTPTAKDVRNAVAGRPQGVIEQLQASPEGREAFAEINREFDEEGVYLKVRGKVHDLYWIVRHMPPEEAAKREFAHHAADIARDVVLERRSFNRIFQIEEAEGLREWLGNYVQSLKDAEARLYERSQ
jgi:hypothetical protein